MPRKRIYTVLLLAMTVGAIFAFSTYRYVQATPERVMLGSDMPFPIGDPEPRKVVEGAYFNDAQKKGILGETAQGVFRVRPDCWCPR